LGRVGFGLRKVSALLGVSQGSIDSLWKERGFKPSLPKSGSWKSETGQTWNAGILVSDQERVERLYASNQWQEWVMAEYRRETMACKRMEAAWPKLYLGRLASLKAAKAKYSGLTTLEKREFNEGCARRRIEKHGMDGINERMRGYRSNRKKVDPGFRASENLRSRLWSAVRRLGERPDAWKFIDLVGCDAATLKEHLEKQFKRWMTWDNYGSKWHIDHIVPCARFDLTKQEEVARCFHWTNLRPLCAVENVRRGAARGVDLQPQFSLSA
jgi:hypothetical protein